MHRVEQVHAVTHFRRTEGSIVTSEFLGEVVRYQVAVGNTCLSVKQPHFLGSPATPTGTPDPLAPQPVGLADPLAPEPDEASPAPPDPAPPDIDDSSLRFIAAGAAHRPDHGPACSHSCEW